jgi:hypothetical protein
MRPQAAGERTPERGASLELHHLARTDLATQRVKDYEPESFGCAALISLIGLPSPRSAGATLLRALVYALFVLAGAVTIAVVKNLLGGH